MIFTETRLKGAFIIDVEKREDPRGFFARGFCRDAFAAHGLAFEPRQGNIAGSRRRGTLRGLHMQVVPHEEAKLVRCTRGAMYDVMVDVRSGSSTYGEWVGVELTSDSHRMVYVPEGFLHGYLTLTDDVEAFYFVSDVYAPDTERGARWNDPRFEIDWPDVGELILSDKDRAWPDWEQAQAAAIP
jgi:dTDP-4-dehydrorhamnose 3,5-epimerase